MADLFYISKPISDKFCFMIPRDKIKPKVFSTHDNGGRLYKIAVSKNDIKIYEINESEYEESLNTNYNSKIWSKIHKNDELIKTITEFEGYWQGYGPCEGVYNYSFVFNGSRKKFEYDGRILKYSGWKQNDTDYDKWWIGNSVLIKLKEHKYMFVGAFIYEFTTKDEIIKFYSPVGRNDVPYPFAVGNTYTYFVNGDYVKCKNTDIDKYITEDNAKNYPRDDMYSFYYDFNKKVKFTEM